VASARLYGALLALYPKAFRRRYSEEMRRDFRELLREGLEEGGRTELVRVWVQAHSDLVLTALKERSTSPARRYASYLSVDPRIAARAAARARVAVVLVAVAMSVASLWQTPTWEASAQVLVDEKQSDRQSYLTGSGEEIQTLPPGGEGLRETIILTMAHVIDSRPVAEEAIGRLGLRTEPAELLDNLTIEQVENTSFIRLTCEGTDPVKAQQIANTVGEVSSELLSKRSAAGSKVRAAVHEEAIVPESPVSPDPLRNGLLTLVMGLGLCAGLALTLPRPLAAMVAGKLGGRIRVRQGVGQAGLPAVPPTGPSEAEGIKEKELLQALGRRGKLTAVEAALETSLSVEEAEGMLQALAAKGHLEVTVEHGRLLYALWDRDAPL
jgi:capsular polysaccharide biosynthesis protein